MALTVTATVGSASANSFVTVAEATLYLEARLNSSAWTGTEPQKAAVIEATRELSRLNWQGYRTDATQALSWPRVGVINSDAPVNSAIGTYTGYPEYDDDVIPTRLKEATIELALESLRAGTTDIFALDSGAGVIRKKVDVLETEWEPGSRAVGLARYSRVLQLVAPLLAIGVGSRQVVRS